MTRRDANILAMVELAAVQVTFECPVFTRAQLDAALTAYDEGEWEPTTEEVDDILASRDWLEAVPEGWRFR